MEFVIGNDLSFNPVEVHEEIVEEPSHCFDFTVEELDEKVENTLVYHTRDVSRACWCQQVSKSVKCFTNVCNEYVTEYYLILSQPNSIST